MALPRTLIYNDLTGEEVKHILLQRFADLLNDIPYLQKHITLPRVRMSLMVTLECWADQPYPETRQLLDQVEIRSEGANPPTQEPIALYKEFRVDSSPKGQPPDKVREDHGLGVPTPTRGPLSTEDVIDGRRVLMPNGAIVDRTGKSEETRGNATVVKQDFGPARERMQRDTVLPLGNRDRRSGPVAPPNFSLEDKE